MGAGIPSWGPPEETSGELLGAPHRSFGPDGLSGTAPAIGEKPLPNYDWLGGFKMLNYHRFLGVVLVSHLSTN